ncbi:MAG TPA: phosphoribosyl-AMP cyclohydrolase [Ktedonobacteraceae bacterium]|nr:phosphoribosyl-AMP cyclohydrolase [Ktedonobacteraceae bacterium]
MTTTPLPELTFYQYLDKDLIPVVIQQRKTLEVLMLGTMSRESLTLTLENDIVYLFALSRNELWLKGEKSGIHLNVKEIRVNCNNTNLLILVDYESNICHTGARSCFYRRLVKRDGNWFWEEIEEEVN